MYEALGIVNFENSDVTVGGLTDYRPVSALSFLGRFRMIDFVLSNMTNSGIQNIHFRCICIIFGYCDFTLNIQCSLYGTSFADVITS